MEDWERELERDMEAAHVKTLAMPAPAATKKRTLSLNACATCTPLLTRRAARSRRARGAGVRGGRGGRAARERDGVMRTSGGSARACVQSECQLLAAVAHAVVTLFPQRALFFLLLLGRLLFFALRVCVCVRAWASERDTEPKLDHESSQPRHTSCNAGLMAICSVGASPMLVLASMPRHRAASSELSDSACASMARHYMRRALAPRIVQHAHRSWVAVVVLNAGSARLHRSVPLSSWRPWYKQLRKLRALRPRVRGSSRSWRPRPRPRPCPRPRPRTCRAQMEPRRSTHASRNWLSLSPFSPICASTTRQN